MSLQRVHAFNGPWPLHGVAASREIETQVSQGLAPHALMARAGLSLARLASALHPHAQRIQIWAGPGNNGGDGLVAARHLHAAGRAVQVNLLADVARLPPDAAWALHAARDAGVAIVDGIDAPQEAASLVIDALLGLGASRAPGDAMAAAIDRINAGAAAVLAVDIPSGLAAETGAVLGASAVRAQHTLSLLTLKPGCFTGHGRDHAGQVWLDALGAAANATAAAQAWLTSATEDAISHRATHASHKGSFGDVAIVGGAPGMAGAAWLAARAALAAGAGRVYCSLLDETASLLDPTRPELMGRPRWWLSAPSALAAATVACGCGGSEPVRDALPPLLSHAGRLVLDADALNAIAADASLHQLLRRRRERGLPTLLTPHPLEAARLLGQPTAQVQGDRCHAAARLAADTGAAVLLKGSGTVIAAPGGSLQINSTGNAALATAGTGDVLAGWAAGLWAQHPAWAGADVAAAAAWQHGRAADVWVQAGRAGPLRASDLVEALATAASAHRRPV